MARNWYGICFQLETTPMIRLSTSGSHLPIRLHQTSEVDRKTYKNWARGCFVCYFLLIAGLLIAGLSTRHSDTQPAKDQTAGIGIVAEPVQQHHSGE
jgi:hypothetical protein